MPAMQFEQPFLKLPIRFDAQALDREVRALPESAWVPHPTGFKGNEAVRLVTVGGEPSDRFAGPMRPTENLDRCPYIRQIMDEIDGVWSRSRLMGLGPGAEVPVHIDSHYHWRTHIRIHIPVITDPKVLFTCGDETIHMAPGECWLFDSFRWHRVENGWTERRVHLVLDTIMTDTLRGLVDAALSRASETKYVAPDPAHRSDLRFEQVNVPMVMSPWEVRCHVEFILDNALDHPRLPAVRDRLDRFADSWAAVWAEFTDTAAGVPAYRELLAQCHADIATTAGEELKMRNTLLVRDVLNALVFGPAVSQQFARGPAMASVANPRQRLAS
ncbi:MAG TPA: aspartyl/asparaginyl beta-hydroxylase domain-containing protein [Sphingomicrobium sp.]|nr:aspartyl/asparaginyl beta-hydroxylase domain-containing protein [Sphingomicrobium sp.]